MVKALGSTDVMPFKLCVAVMDQLPMPSEPKVQEALPDESAGAVVQVTFVEDAFVAVTVAVAPSVRPTRSTVGVLSWVMSSVEMVPVSEAELRSGADKAASPTIPVAEEVPTILPPTFVAVTTERMYLPT